MAQDSNCCKCRALSILKYLFHIFNLLYLICGISIVLFGGWTILKKWEFLIIQDIYVYPMIIYVFSAAGLAILLTSVIGYSGVWKEDRCTILYYAVLMITTLLVMSALGVISFIYQEQLETEIGRSLNGTFVRDYSVDHSRTLAIDHIQSQLRCCGANTFEEWKQSAWYVNRVNQSVPVPDSCCISPSLNCGKRTHPSNIYYTGCSDVIAHQIRYDLRIIELAAITLTSLLLLNIILTCSLRVRLHKRIY